MTQFDESKVNRDADGQFASKGPAAEDTSVSLADPAEDDAAWEKEHDRLMDRMQESYGGDDREIARRSLEVVEHDVLHTFPEARYLKVDTDISEDGYYYAQKLYRADGTEIEGAFDDYDSDNDWSDTNLALSNLREIPKEYEHIPDDAEGRQRWEPDQIDLVKVRKDRQARSTTPDLEQLRRISESYRRDADASAKRAERAEIALMAGQTRRFLPGADSMVYADAGDKKMTLVAVKDASGAEMPYDVSPSDPGATVQATSLPEDRTWETVGGVRQATFKINDAL